MQILILFALCLGPIFAAVLSGELIMALCHLIQKKLHKERHVLNFPVDRSEGRRWE